MRRILMTVLMLEILICGTALGQIDPAPNGFGIYFDMDATEYCSNEPATGLYDAYLMITNPTNLIIGIEFQLTMTIDGVAGTPTLDFEAPITGAFTAPNYRHYIDGGLPDSPVVHVATHSGATFNNVIRYYMAPIDNMIPSVPNSMCYVDAEDAGHLIVLNPSSGSFDLPVATHGMEDCDIVPNEEETWGSVKLLYR